MNLKIINEVFSICKVEDYSGIDLNQNYVFTGSTDEEKSLVFGILSKISACLADNGIGIFAISTFNTDYILTKNGNFDKAIKSLTDRGYTIT